MDEYVLQGDGQQGQMDAGQPLTAADVTFSEPAQNQQQPQPVAQEDAFAGFTPSEP